MKWFKHDTDCDDSEGLSMLIEKHGWEGYGRWFRILETVAKKMDETDRCSVTYPASKWQEILNIYHRRSLEDWLQSLANLCSILVQCEGNLITISIPNLLKKRDEYSKKSRQTPDNVHPKNKEVRIKKEEDGATARKHTKNPILSDDEWLAVIKANPAYQGIDVDKLRAKMEAWCITKELKPTRRRLLNWLNREEKPLQAGKTKDADEPGFSLSRSGNKPRDPGISK